MLLICQYICIALYGNVQKYKHAFLFCYCKIGKDTITIMEKVPSKYQKAMKMTLTNFQQNGRH